MNLVPNIPRRSLRLKKEEYLKAVKARVNAEVNQYGVDVIQFGFTGALRMDPGIMGR